MPTPENESWPPDLTRFLLERGLIPELDDTLVELVPGLAFRRSFLADVPLNDNGSERLVLHIRVDPDARAPQLLEARHIWKRGIGLPDIPDERVRRITEYVVAEEATKQAAKRMMGDASGAVVDNIRDHFPELGEIPPGVAILDSAELVRVEQRALRTVRPKQGPKPVSADRKLEALKWYEEGGIPLAMERTGRAERTLRRWIADARNLEHQDN